jgi:hypothetical protein
MAVAAESNTVHQLKSRFAVKIWIAPVDSGCKCVGELKVGLRGYRRKVKRPPGILDAQFID